MESKIKYKDEYLELCEDFTDIGYIAENVEVEDIDGKKFEIKRSNSDKSMTLLVSFPKFDEFQDEILKLDEFMSHIQVDINCYLLFNEKVNISNLKKFQVAFDVEDEFGNMYGAKIVSGSLEDKLTKSLFLISKDGAIFYLDIPSDLSKTLDLQRLQVELNKAYVTYTGVGCHG